MFNLLDKIEALAQNQNKSKKVYLTLPAACHLDRPQTGHEEYPHTTRTPEYSSERAKDKGHNPLTENPEIVERTESKCPWFGVRCLLFCARSR